MNNPKINKKFNSLFKSIKCSQTHRLFLPINFSLFAATRKYSAGLAMFAVFGFLVLQFGIGATPARSQDELPVNVNPEKTYVTPRLTEKIFSTKTENPLSFNIANRLTACTPTQISYGQTIIGNMNTGDCPNIPNYFDDYIFSGTAGDQINIGEFSYQFVDRVELFHPNGTLLAADTIVTVNPELSYRQISFTLPVTGTYFVRVNALLSQGTTPYYPNAIGDYFLSIAKNSSACGYSANSSNFFANGLSISSNNAFSGSIKIVTTNPGCFWTITSSVPWLTFSSGSGTGTTTVNFSVAANSTGSPRRGDFTVAGLTIPVYQYSSIPCSSTSISYGQTKTGDFSPSDCIENQLYIGGYADEYVFNGTAGDQIFISTSAVSLSPGKVTLLLFRPNGTRISLSIGSRLPAQNFLTLSETGVYRIRTSSLNPLDLPNSTGTYTVSLAVLTCTYTLSASDITITAGGSQNNTVNVVRDNLSCPLVATTNDSWITVSTVVNGNNNATINYAVAENTGNAARTGTIRIGAQTFTVNQQAPPACSGGSRGSNIIKYGQSITSTLSSDSCQANTLFSDLSSFAGQDGDQIAVSLNAGFDSKLELIDPQGAVIQTVNGNDASQAVRLPASAPFFSLPSTGNYTIRVSSEFLGGAGEYNLTLYQVPTGSVSCSYSVSPSGTTVPASGGTFFFDVITQNGCPPFVPSSLSGAFYSITSTGGGRISFSVNPNNSVSDRQATIVIGAQTHSIFQYGSVPPANDAFAAARLISGGENQSEGFATGYNSSATAEAGETTHSGSPAAKSVWFRFTAPSAASGFYSFTTSGSSFDTVMDIYACPASDDCSLANATLVGTNDDTTAYDKTSKVNIRAAAGVTYYIAVDGKDGEDGTVMLSFQQYERLYRLYLQTYNGDPSPITPDSVVAANGSRTVEAKKISSGVYEFNLPSDKSVYRVRISGPTGIAWDPNDIVLDDSFAALDKPANQTALAAPTDGTGSGQNFVSNATNATPRFIVGYIKNITGQELSLLSVKIGFSQGANPRDPVACAKNDAPIGATPYVIYQCQTQPNTLHEIIPSMAGKVFTQPIKFFPYPIVNDEFGLPSNALVASNAATYNINGRVLEGGAGTIVDLSYTPPGTTQIVGSRTTTGADGFYEFKNLTPNVYQVKATRTGFAFNEIESVNLQANATIDIGTRTVCSYTPSSTINTIGAAGGSGQFTITTNNPTCEWATRTNAAWIVINSGATVGNGAVYYTIEANTGAARSGTLIVGGQTVTINQATASKSRKRIRLGN